MVKGETYKGKEISNNPSDKSKYKKDTPSEVQVEKPNENEYTHSEATVNEEATIEETSDSPFDQEIKRIEHFEEKQNLEVPQAKEIVKAVKRYTENEYEPMDTKLKLGIIFLSMAILAFLFYILFYVQAQQVEIDDSSADGCFASLFDIAFFSMISIVFGIGTIVFLTLGIVFVILGVVSMEKKKAAK